MHWIIFGVMLILAQSPARRKCQPHQFNAASTSTSASPVAAAAAAVAQLRSHVRHRGNENCGSGWSSSLLVEASPVPLNLDPRPAISPYIRHWEPATYDRHQIATDRLAHEDRREQRRRRRKRDIRQAETTGEAATSAEYFDTELNGAGGELRFSFFAHDRQFNVVLREDPASVFAPDVEIENNIGPVRYDLTRVYTGTLEDDPDAIVHGILTADHLFDGTITTAWEQYYVEPADRYSPAATDATSTGNGGRTHSIVYRVSDVRHPSDVATVAAASHHPPMKTSQTKDDDDGDDGADDATGKSSQSVWDSSESAGGSFCASERLRQKMQMDFKRRRKLTTSTTMMATSADTAGSASGDISRPEAEQMPAYAAQTLSSSTDASDAASISLAPSSHRQRSRRWLPEELTESRNPPLPLDLDVPYNDDFSVYRDQNPNANVVVHPAGILTKSGPNPPRTKSILIGDYNPNSDYNLRHNQSSRNHIITNSFDQAGAASAGSGGSPSSGGGSSRPSHKTHVEIITKHGATKKPNIIGNNYHPPHSPGTDQVLVTSTTNGGAAGSGGAGNHPHHGAHLSRDLPDSGPTSSVRAENRKVTCMLYLQADHTFYSKMGSEEASIEAITRHVQRANVIYKGTDFNGDGKADNITFMIKRIKVHTNSALKDPNYRFPGNYGVEKFLELFSEEDYDAFCLAYMFTYRDFEMGTLGLAWTGDLKNAGGVCEKNGHYRGSLKSLNTGIVTLLNYGKHVPPAVSHVTLAHEIGHNFGSPHDPEQCTPGGEDGNFIMFARATSGDKRNNNRFSPCSLKAIEPVLNTKARSHKGCFTEPQVAICGNGVVDPGEQCDCGWEDDCKDQCCFPMSRQPDANQRPCTLTPAASCSPSQGPCCTDSCRLRLGDKCRNDNGCRDESFCDGRRPQCPPSHNKPNKTICNKEFVCYMGECTGSICLAYGLESCQCVARPTDAATKPCELCCKGEDGVCKSSFEWNVAPYDVPDMFAKPGTPCNEYNGYCDVFQKCRDVDPSGPLATLRKILLSEENFERFRVWCVENWWKLLLGFCAVLGLMFITCWLLDCGYSATKHKRKMKKKSVTIIHSATTETVRLPDDNNGVIVHTAVRTKVPFKKKVRGERSSKPKGYSSQQQSSAHQHAGDGGRKKKRIAAPVIAEDPLATGGPVAVHIETPPAAAVAASTKPAKSKSSKASKSKHSSKEVIDYSKQNGAHTNTFGKVHKWLLESHSAGEAAATQIPALNASDQKQQSGKPGEASAGSSRQQAGIQLMSKSQSTPEHLTSGKRPAAPVAGVSAAVAATKMPSTSNLNEKVKLHVVYKPPFKFSLKFSKNPAFKTKVVAATAAGTAATTANAQRLNASKVGKVHRAHRSGETGHGKATDAPPSSRRTALLVQSVVDAADAADIDDSGVTAGDDAAHLVAANFGEPTYETLTPKRADSGHRNTGNPAALASATATTAPLYENLTVPPINTATFRISKSASGSSLKPSKQPQRHGARRSAAAAAAALSNSQTDLHADGDTPFGSSQNLIRSSTSNLTKAGTGTRHSHSHRDQQQQPQHLSRSSTTNLSKQRRMSSGHRSQARGSNPSLSTAQPEPGEMQANASTTGSGSGSRRNSVNNIPRANLSGRPSGGGASFNRHSRYASGTAGAAKPRERPHTADCTDGAGPPAMLGFEWPAGLRKKSAASMAASAADEPLPSDLEVMVSDVENLVTDT